jgi:hypothetical protein
MNNNKENAKPKSSSIDDPFLVKSLEIRANPVLNLIEFEENNSFDD